MLGRYPKDLIMGTSANAATTWDLEKGLGEQPQPLTLSPFCKPLLASPLLVRSCRRQLAARALN